MLSMNRIDSPLQAKAKRRQSDAKWRASVATCYDTLKYVVPNVKNMAKRKISKALILQESEKHIKELESAVTQLLEVEGKKREKTVLWEEESHWTHCTLGKLRQDFSEKQQRVFQMAAHGRRCYNLLQDIKEEVFAMEADPSRLAIMEETFQATSSLPSKICTLNAPNIAREGADTGQGVPPIHKINLVLSGPSTANQQQSLAPRFNRRDSNLETTTSQVVPKLLTHASSGPDLPSTLIPMSRKNQTSHIESKPITLMANFSTLPNCTSENVSSVDKRICALSNNSCTSNGNINVLAGTNKSFSTLRLSNNQEGPAASHGYSQGFFKDNSDFSDSKSHVTSAGAASVENSQRLKIHIERVNGDFYIISDSRNSMIHLIKATPSTGVVTSSEVQLQKTSLLAENDQDQEVPSMKLPVKLPTNTEQEENENYSCRQQFSSAGFRELLRDNSCIKQDIQASLSVCSASDGSSEEAFETVQENIGNFYTVDISSEISERSTPCHRETTLPQALDIKEENVDTYTTRNNRDPLLSSLATPKPDDSTPLFMRTDNDLIIKRPPKMGTARKKLNFGQSPDKHNSWNTVKAHRQAGGFTPVKLPNEFGMVPDEDGNSIGSLISPWKIVDSPSYACGVSTQNCLASATMLDLDDSLICLETMDTMDLEDHCDSNNMFAAPGTEEDKIERTVKRKVSPISPGVSIRQQPKCRKKLDKFYEDTSLSGEENRMKNYVPNTEDNQSVPDIYTSIKKEILHQLSNVDHHCAHNPLNENGAKQASKNEDEESHVVPDFNVKGNTTTTGDHYLTQQELHEPPCLQNSAFYSSNDCDDFDGFYYYYRLMSQEWRQDNKNSTDLKHPAEVSACSEPAHPTTVTPSNHLNLVSSPSIAARVAHMWSCLPLHDKLTMATLANLEERQSRRSVIQLSPGSSVINHLNILYNNQKCDPHNIGKSNQFCTNERPDSQDLVQVKLESNPNLDQLGTDDGGKYFAKMLQASRDESKGGSLQCQLHDFHGNLSLFDNLQRSEINQDCVAIVKGFEHVEGIHNSFHSSNNIQTVSKNELFDNAHDSFQSENTLKVLKTEVVEKIDLQSQHVANSQDIFVFGELSPDLQEVEIQPLTDHTYDHVHRVHLR